MRRILKEYFEDIYNIYTQEQVNIFMCGFYEVRLDSNFGGNRLGNLKVR